MTDPAAPDLPAALSHQLAHVDRSVAHDANADVDVRLTQTFDAPVDDVWGALTDPERLPLWLSPVEGELREGGTVRVTLMQVAARVLTCQAPRALTLQWGVDGTAPQGSSPSVLDLQLESHPGDHPRTTLSVRHHVPDDEHHRTYGPSAVGAGWDCALLGMWLHLADPHTDHVTEMAGFAESAEGSGFLRDSCAAWGEADARAGIDPAQARERADRSSAFFRGEQ